MSSDDEPLEADSDDEPLSALGDKKPKARPKIVDSDDDDDDDGDDGIEHDESTDEEAEYEAEDDDDDDDEAVSRTSSSRKRAATASVNYGEESDDDDDDSEDDVPLSKLKSKKAPAKSSPAKKKTPTKKKASPKKKVKKVESPGPSSGNFQSASAALYAKCDKGQLVQELLRRWWYSIEWPDPSVIPEEPPRFYDALDGFPGVFICTEGDEVGHIMDLRNKDDCPNFDNFAKKPADELQKLLISALEKQKEQLRDVEGPDTPTEKDINSLIKWANKVKPSTADKEAEKVLKSFKVA